MDTKMKETMNRAFRPLAFLAALLSLVGAAPASAVDQSDGGSTRGRGKDVVAQEPSRRVLLSPGGPSTVRSPGAPEEAVAGTRTGSRARASLATGCEICLGGNASTTWTGSSGSFHVDTITNNRTSGTSGSMDLRMALTVAAPVFGQTVNYFSLSAFVTIPPLTYGHYYSGVDSGTVSFLGSSIPVGEYFLLMFLRENVSGTYYYADFVVMDKKVSCNGSGCSTITPPAPCAEDAYTMCLVNGRYKVTSTWKNQFAGGATATLSKAKLTDVTGAFWIANKDTYEYMIRVNTATDNGRAWMTILTFTSVEFFVDVTDTKTGQFKEYHSAPGNVTLIYDPSTFVYP